MSTASKGQKAKSAEAGRGPGYRYTAEFRREALRMVDGGKSATTVSAELGVSMGTLRQWRSQAEGVAARGGESGSSGESVTAENDRLKRELKALRMEFEIAKKAVAFFHATAHEVHLHRSRESALPRDGSMPVLGSQHERLLRVAGRPKSARSIEDDVVGDEVKAAHAKSQARYGSPRMMHQLRRQGRRVSRKRVARLMRAHGLFGRKRRRFRTTTDSKHEDPIAPNLVNRNFTVDTPGTVMVGDTTAIETRQGWLYLAVLVDLCTRAIVGWSMSENNDTRLVAQAFRLAMRRGFRRGFIHHTDRGSTYASDDYRQLVERAGGRRSMSRKADCYDNAVAESVFRTIKEEGIGDRVPETPEEARRHAFAFIEGFYNSERLHSTLGYRTPNEFEQMKLDEESKKRQSA